MGLSSWFDTEIIEATTAENKPVYVAFQLARTTVMGETVGTHENNDPLSIFLPSLSNLIILFLRNL